MKFGAFVCLFVFSLNVPVNNFSVMSGRGHRFLGFTSTVLRCVLCALVYNTHLIFRVRSGEKILVPIYNTRYFRGIGFIVT